MGNYILRTYISGLYPTTNIRGFISRGLISAAYISVHRFFKATVDKVPLKRLYVPELEKETVVTSIQRAALLKGRSSGAILRLREAINSPKWYHAWVKLILESFGLFGSPQKSHGRLNKGVYSTMAFCGPPMDGFYERVDSKSTTRE